MLVLGTHLFDLIRFFAGDASWCAARVLQNGHEITSQDAHPAKENIGPIAGDEIEAHFGFANGISASFTSRGKLQQQIGHWGLELIGSKTSARILADIVPDTQQNVLPAGRRNVRRCRSKPPTSLFVTRSLFITRSLFVTASVLLNGLASDAPSLRGCGISLAPEAECQQGAGQRRDPQRQSSEAGPVRPLSSASHARYSTGSFEALCSAPGTRLVSGCSELCASAA